MTEHLAEDLGDGLSSPNVDETDQYIGEIRAFGFNFAPRGWATCDGQLLAISQNLALFSVIGTTYGGNGSTNFGLPNLGGRIPVGPGQGKGLSIYTQGESIGSDTVTLLSEQMAVHNHLLTAQTIDQGDNRIPGPTLNLGNTQTYSNAASTTSVLSPSAIAITGGNLPHNNLMPYVTMNFCIALEGIYPKV